MVAGSPDRAPRSLYVMMAAVVVGSVVDDGKFNYSSVLRTGGARRRRALNGKVLWNDWTLGLGAGSW